MNTQLPDAAAKNGRGRDNMHIHDIPIAGVAVNGIGARRGRGRGKGNTWTVCAARKAAANIAHIAAVNDLQLCHFTGNDMGNQQVPTGCSAIAAQVPAEKIGQGRGEKQQIAAVMALDDVGMGKGKMQVAAQVQISVVAAKVGGRGRGRGNTLETVHPAIAAQVPAEKIGQGRSEKRPIAAVMAPDDVGMGKGKRQVRWTPLEAKWSHPSSWLSPFPVMNNSGANPMLCNKTQSAVGADGDADTESNASDEKDDDDNDHSFGHIDRRTSVLEQNSDSELNSSTSTTETVAGAPPDKMMPPTPQLLSFDESSGDEVLASYATKTRKKASAPPSTSYKSSDDEMLASSVTEAKKKAPAPPSTSYESSDDEMLASLGTKAKMKARKANRVRTLLSPRLLANKHDRTTSSHKMEDKAHDDDTEADCDNDHPGNCTTDFTHDEDLLTPGKGMQCCPNTAIVSPEDDAVAHVVRKQSREVISGLPQAAKVILCIALSLSQVWGQKAEIRVTQLKVFCEEATKHTIMDELSFSDVMNLVEMLVDSGLLLARNNGKFDRHDVSTKLMIGVQLDDVEIALDECLLRKGGFYRKLVNYVKRKYPKGWQNR